MNNKIILIILLLVSISCCKRNRNGDSIQYNVIIVKDERFDKIDPQVIENSLRSSLSAVNFIYKVNYDYNNNMIYIDPSKIIDENYDNLDGNCKIKKIDEEQLQSKKDCICSSLRKYSLANLSTYINYVNGGVHISNYEEACSLYFNNYIKLIQDLTRNEPSFISIVNDDMAFFEVDTWIDHNNIVNANNIIFINSPIYETELNTMPPHLILRGGFVITLRDDKTNSIFVSLYPFQSKNKTIIKFGRRENINQNDLEKYIIASLFYYFGAHIKNLPTDYKDKKSIMFPVIQFRFDDSYTIKQFESR